MEQQEPASGSLKFAAAQRLKQTWEFEKVRQQGQRLARGCLILNWQIIQDRTFSRVGVITSKKVGNSVVRSRARRLLRESFRLHQHELGTAVDMVLVARPSLAGKVFKDVERDYLAALRQARLIA